MAIQTSLTGKAQAGGKFEIGMWFITRVTGILLLLMAAFNIVYANLAGGQGKMWAGAQIRWAFFPISFHVNSTPVEVAPNFSNAFWQFYSFLFIAFAATHGVNGMRVVLTDYIRHPLLLAWVKALLVVVWLSFLLGAVYLIFVAQGAG